MKHIDPMITDKFPLKELDCQYFEICKYYNPSKCTYDKSCTTYITITNKDKMIMRELFRKVIENYISKDCLDYQVRLIDEEIK